MHADHTAGLTSSWNTYTIYCSEVTRKLVIAKLGVNSDLVVGLPLDEGVIIKLDEAGKETMTVTLVDANHCPGSVMFIFEGYFGRILYTGDFRYCERFRTHSAIQGKQFDVLYLDNTYCDPRCVFPSRTQATVNILDVIRNHPECKVAIGLHYLGKEMLLHTIALMFKTWIGVDPSRLETLKLLEMPNVFTCEVDRVRIRVVKSQEITKNNVQFWNSQEPTIAILPTCLFVGSTNPFANVENVFVFPYSDHSSFEELRKFVQNVQPRTIIPIVHKHRLSPGETVNSRVNMNVFQDLMDSSPSTHYTVPLSVQCFMTAEVQQETKKKGKATARLCLRKAAKVKKPRGVVFPPSQEATEMNEDKGDSEMSELDEKSTAVKSVGYKEHSKKQIKGEENAGAFPSNCDLAGGDSGGKSKVNSDSTKKDLVAQDMSEEEINEVSSLAAECGSVHNESEGDLDERGQGEACQILGNKIDKVDSLSIKSGFVDSESRVEINLDNASDGKGFQEDSRLQEIAGDEIALVAASSARNGLADSESGKKLKVSNHKGDKEPSVVQRNKGDEQDTADLSVRTKDMCDEYNSPNTNLLLRKQRGDKTSAAPHIKTTDISSKNIVPIQNLSIKRKYRELTEDNDENNINNADKHSSQEKKFNIYTGYSCDFARKVLEEMVGNGSFRNS